MRFLIMCLFAWELDSQFFPLHFQLTNCKMKGNPSNISRRFLEFDVIQLTSTEYLLCVVLGSENAIFYQSERNSHGFYNLALRNHARTKVDTKSIIYFAMST